MSPASNNGRYMIGIDIGATKILIGVVDSENHVLSRKKRRSKGGRKSEETLERLARGIMAAVRDAGIDLGQIQGIGVGAPGPLDQETGVILSPPNLKWKNIPLKAWLEKRFGVPVFVDNDVNVGTLGEYVGGAGQGCEHLVGIFVGTGIGGGLVINGDLYRGFRQAAGEIGHMVLVKDGPLCGCGKKGCLEALASRTAISRDLRAAIEDGAVTVIPQLVDNDLSQIRSRVLAQALESKDALATQVIDRAAEYLGVAIGSIMNLLSPEMVVLGGGVIEAVGSRMLPIIEDTARHYAFSEVMHQIKIVPAALEDDAGIIGGAALARRGLHGAVSTRETPAQLPRKPVSIDECGFGYLVIDGTRYERDVVIHPDGTVAKRKKKLSRKKHGTAHEVSVKEMKTIMGDVRPARVIIGTGHNGRLRLHETTAAWLDQKGISHTSQPTPEAIGMLASIPDDTMALLHVTC